MHNTESDHLTLSEFFSRIFAPRKMLGSSDSTRSKYWIAMRHLGKFLDRQAMLADLTDETVVGCLEMLHQRGTSPATINGYRSKFMLLSDYAARKGLLPEGALDIPKMKEFRRRPNAMTDQQFTDLMRAAENMPGMIGNVPASLWWPSLLLALYDTAARVSAMMAVEWTDVDLVRGIVYLKAENAKHRCDSARVLHPDTVALLRKIERITDVGQVWTWPYHPLYLWQKFDRVCREAGLPAGRRWKFHAIRRTTLTITADRLGVDAATELADHSSDAVTRKSYLDRSRMNGKRPIDVLPRPGGGSFCLGWLRWFRHGR